MNPYPPSVSSPKKLLSLLLLGLGTSATNAQPVSYIPGTLAEPLIRIEGTYRAPQDINETGAMVGAADYNYAWRAALWQTPEQAVKLDLINRFDEENSSASAINDLGHVVGNAKGPKLWMDGQMIALPQGNGVSAINNSGLIVGSSGELAAGVRAIKWQNLSPVLLGGEPAGIDSVATGVNESGDIIGAFYDAADYKYSPVIWRAAGVTQLGKLPGFEDSASAADLNDLAHVVGSSSTALPASRRAVLWRDGLIASLGTLGGDASSARAINNAGLIVGASTVNPGDKMTAVVPIHPFLWYDGAMYDLGPAINFTCTATSRCLSYATAINESNQIAVYSYDANGRQAFRLNITDLATALGQLPRIDAPLKFIAAAGASADTPLSQPEPTPEPTPAPAAEADLEVKLSADRSRIKQGQPVQYRVEIINHGPGVATDAQSRSEFSGNAQLLSVSGASCSNAGELNCQLGEMDAQAQRVFYLTLTATEGKRLKHSVSVSHAANDPDQDNNTDKVKTRVK